MPETPDFDFDAARRALDDVPAPDLWAEAERRAEAGGVVPLTADSGARSRRPTRWLAVAAVAALAIGTVGVLAQDDDAGVEVGPSGQVGPDDPTVVASDGCSYGVSGDPVVLLEGPADPPLFDPSAQPGNQTISHLELGTQQVAEIHVPGLVVTDLVGERVEDVELKRGTAQAWFGPDFVQVRWFPLNDVHCDSFTVTVAGGTEDGNRHVAVDLADRMVLQSELDGPTLRQTEWQLESSTVDGVASDGDGWTVTFRQNDVLWTDGCYERRATFDQSWPRVLDLVGELEHGDEAGCTASSTLLAISAVLRPDPERKVSHTAPSRYTIDVSYEGDLLVLTTGDSDIVLTLRPVDDGAEVPDDPDAAYAIWPITYPGQPTGQLAYPMETTAETAAAFARDVLGWTDAEVDQAQSEPSEDGRNGAVHSVRSAEVGGAVTVWVTQGTGSDGFVVYQVDVPGRGGAEPQGAGLSISGRTAQVNISPVPGGTDHSLVKLVYGDQVLGEGFMGEDIALSASPEIPGRVLVFFNDANGRPISAWGRALPAGDFAAG